jgi:regulator of sigma E protease
MKRVFGEALCGGDKVLAVGGKSIQHPWDLEAILENVGPGAVPIEVKRGGKPATAKVRGSLSWSRAATHLFRLEGKQGHWLFWDANDSNERKDKDTDWFRQPSFNVLGLRPRMQVHDVEPDSPAEEIGLKLGDIITSYTDVKGKLGEVVPSWETFHKINNENRGQVLPIRILRDGNEISLKIKVKKNEDEARVGIASQADDAHLVIADVLPGSPFFGTDDGKALAGSTVTAVNGQTVTTWADLIAALSPLKSDDTVTLFYTTPMGGKGQKTTPIAMEKFGYDSRLPIADYYAWPLLTLPMAPLEGPKMYAPPLAALRQGVHETGDFIVLTYATLKQFIKGRVHGAQFSGPVGIFRMGLQVGEHRGPIWVVWLLAVISANLAVINFLPLPIVDGGHVVFLIIEKIRRRPLSVAVQNAVQIAGLVAIGLAFVLLTYNDIRQWLSSQWH